MDDKTATMHADLATKEICDRISVMLSECGITERDGLPAAYFDGTDGIRYEYQAFRFASDNPATAGSDLGRSIYPQAQTYRGRQIFWRIKPEVLWYPKTPAGLICPEDPKRPGIFGAYARFVIVPNGVDLDPLRLGAHYGHWLCAHGYLEPSWHARDPITSNCIKCGASQEWIEDHINEPCVPDGKPHPRLNCEFDAA